MKYLKTIILVVMAIFVSHTSAIAQDIETIVSQGFTVNANNWKKYLRSGDPVTIFAYKQEADIHSFGIYSDDYAGIIDMKINPFDIQPKQLKKLPKTKSIKIQEKLNLYYKKALTKAREKALAGKYSIIAPDAMDGVYSLDYNTTSIREKESITIFGYKETRDYVGTTYHYAILKDGSAGIYKIDDFSDKKVTLNQIPLSFLPSTDDPQVKSIIEKERRRVVTERQTKEERERTLAYEKKLAEKEEEKRLEAEWKARQDSIDAAKKQEDFARLKSLSPAFIEVFGWSMDSAGGIEVDITFTNCSSQKVKYVYFRGYFLNAVGDRCRNEITRSTEWKYRGVGPIDPFPKSADDSSYGHRHTYFFGNPLFYSSIAKTFRLSSVTIEYMNGKKTTLSGTELKKRVKYPY